METDDVLEKLEQVAPTKARAQGAYRTWVLVERCGLETARSMMPESTWYLHKKLLNAAGLSWADFQARNVVPFRRKTIVLGEPVRSWEELKSVVNQ
jgi:hypothetical protein